MGNLSGWDRCAAGGFARRCPFVLAYRYVIVSAVIFPAPRHRRHCQGVLRVLGLVAFESAAVAVVLVEIVLPSAGLRYALIIRSESPWYMPASLKLI